MCECDFQYLIFCVILQTERLQQYTKFDDSDDDDDDNELDEQEIAKLLFLYSRE